MSHYDAGIELKSATIAPQFQINNSSGDEEPIDNIWTDDPAPFGDATDRVTGTTNSSPFLWLYQTSNGDYNPLDGGTTSPVVAVQSDGAASVDCHDVSNRQSRETRFAATVGDSLAFDYYEVERSWMARKYAYEAMRTDSTLLYQDTLTDQIYQDFFWHEDSLNTGKFGTIRFLSADTSYFGTAETINESVFDEIDLETNLKIANSYYFNNLAIDEPFDSADSSAVLSLAELPYYTAGEAAFITFGMLGLERTPYIPALRIAPELVIPIQSSTPLHNSIQLFPIPVTYYIHFASSNLTIDKVEIFDSQLKLIHQMVVHSREFEMNTGFNPGVYGMKFYLEDGTIQWKKLIKF
ncbi:MAG: T9SS type A sorting domain-containing protein [Bacteroidetes bacterium]|nr:T9SS type A sorting domain-containing protein [Bacteroidota bacterium]